MHVEEHIDDSMPSVDYLGALPDIEQLERYRPLIHQHYPSKWVADILNEETWSGQREFLDAYMKHRRVAFASCHKIGKTHAVVRIAAHHITIHPPGEAGFITSAPSDPQVRFLFWREFNRLVAAHPTIFPGQANQKEYYITGANGNQEICGFGRKPRDLDFTGFQGAHYLRLLMIFDESCGMPDPLWDGAESLMASEHCKFVAIGNPDDPNTRFAQICKPGSGWKVIQYGAFDTPNFTGERISSALSQILIGPTWVEEQKRSWGEDSPRYISKIRGEFPDASQSNLIPPSWVEFALKSNTLTPSNDAPNGVINELGMDVGAGGDRNVIAHRYGPTVKIIRRDHEPNTMTSLGNLINDMRATGAIRAKVDYIGVGQGVVDRAREIARESLAHRAFEKHRLYSSIIGVRVSSSPNDPERFFNLRAEGFYNLRQLLQDQQLRILPNSQHPTAHNELASQLCAIERKPTSSGKELLVPKQESKKKYHVEMDDADAVMLAFLGRIPQSKKKRLKRPAFIGAV